MSRLLAEQPVLLAILLSIIAAACLYGWMQSGKRALAVMGIVFLVLIPGGFWLASVWETDREQIMQLVTNTATAVQANDVDTVLESIDPQLPDIRPRAETELPNYIFSQASVGQFRSITFVSGAVPPEAVVDITANVVVSHSRGSFANAKVSRRVIFRCRKLEDRWFVSDYTHLPVVGNPDGFTPDSELTRTYRDY